MALKASISYQEQPRQARHGKYIEDGVEAQAFYRTTGILEVRDNRRSVRGSAGGGCGAKTSCSARNDRSSNNPSYMFGRRIVPGFSVQARQADVIVEPPQKQKVFHPLPLQATSFRKLYNRGDFPIAIDFGARGKRIAWKIEIEKLDYHHYLPLFFDGLSETVHPYEFFARQGCHDLLEHGGERVLPVVPQLIIPIKRALNTRNSEVICHTLKVMQHMILACELVGEALVPYYRQILPVLNLYRIKNCNLGDGIEYGQMRRENLGDLITETLELMERYGGEDAFINIKYMVPTYESVVLN